MPGHRVLMSFDRGPGPALEKRLQLRMHLYDVGSYSVWESAMPTTELFAALPGLMRENVVWAAAVLARIPDHATRWIAVEWRGRVVVSAELAEAIGGVPAGWEEVGRSDRQGLHIWAEAVERLPGLRVVETREDFRAALETNAPVVTRYVMPEQVADAQADEAGFGRLAVDGGVIALLTMSRCEPGEAAILRNPAALDLEVSSDMTELKSLMRAGLLNVAAVGINRNGEVPRSFIRSCLRENAAAADVDRLHAEFEAKLAETRHDDRHYRVLMYLEAPAVDPQVVIPTGAIFEQTSFNGVQTLGSAAQPQTIVVNPGTYVPVALPAWCLNRNLSAPSGQPVSPTVLRYRGTGSQIQVWSDLNARLDATTP
jgi:hypothetical protein